MKNKAIYKFNFDCGRQGTLTGTFIEDKSYVEYLIKEGIVVYFGEVLGKHSEVYGKIDEGEIIFVSDDPQNIKVMEDLKLESGYNPFEYTEFMCEDEGMEDATIREIIEKRLNPNP